MEVYLFYNISIFNLIYMISLSVFSESTKSVYQLAKERNRSVILKASTTIFQPMLQTNKNLKFKEKLQIT